MLKTDNKPKSIHLPDCFRLIGTIPKMRHELEVLSNGLAICKILVLNPFFENDLKIECNALIDTGAEFSVICQSIFNQFKIDKERIEKRGISTITNDEDDNIVYPFHLIIPSNNWTHSGNYLMVRDLSIRNEYKVIIGVNILRDFDLFYSGNQRKAWLEF